MMLPVVILAGGLATRMRPVSSKIPKSMIDVNGKPFIHHQLSLLKRRGVRRVLLCVGFMGEAIKQYAGDGSQYNLELEYYFDGDTLLGTGGAIKHIGESLPEEFFILYGDSYLDIDYKKIGDAWSKSGKDALMTVFRNENEWDTSNVVFVNGQIISYSKKNKTENMHYIDWGLGILKKELFSSFPSNAAFDLSAVYEKLVSEYRLFGYEVFCRFFEIGSPKGLADLCKQLS
jgi:NDP-sugar pyrophosphorylase family protein